MATKPTPSSERENKECLCYKSHTTTPISCGCYCHDKKVDAKDAEIERLQTQENKWQSMCEEFVGCSMLADEFRGEPHEPENFKDYIKNLLRQIESMNSRLSAAEKVVEAARQLEQSFGREWFLEHQEDDHFVSMNHKDEIEVADIGLAIMDALEAYDKQKEDSK